MEGMADASALSRMMQEAPAVDSVQISIDEMQRQPLFYALKAMPVVAGVALQRVSLANFREMLAVIVTTMASIAPEN